MRLQCDRAIFHLSPGDHPATAAFRGIHISERDALFTSGRTLFAISKHPKGKLAITFAFQRVRNEESNSSTGKFTTRNSNEELQREAPKRSSYETLPVRRPMKVFSPEPNLHLLSFDFIYHHFA